MKKPKTEKLEWKRPKCVSILPTLKHCVNYFEEKYCLIIITSSVIRSCEANSRQTKMAILPTSLHLTRSDFLQSNPYSFSMPSKPARRCTRHPFVITFSNSNTRFFCLCFGFMKGNEKEADF